MTDEQLIARWSAVSLNYRELAKTILPEIQRLANLEKELQSLIEEIEVRGIRIADTQQGGRSSESA